ncbi:hypothetical protein BAE44_0008976, partial [Dichanthelium oligosanthes]
LSTHSFAERFVKWIQPPLGFVKVNIDAATSKNSNTAAATAVACDGAGNFLGALALVLEGLVNAEAIEAIACREGLALACDLVLQNVRVASDCANVIKSIRGSGMGQYGPIVRGINARRASFTRVEFVHEGRDSNGDEHRLARSSVWSPAGRRACMVSGPTRWGL